MPELHKGDVVAQHHGPFRSMWRVVSVLDIGAVLEYIPDSVNFIGFTTTMSAPNGDTLTSDPKQTFLGCAHWPNAEVVS